MDRDRAKRMASKKEGKREIKRERVKRREIATSGGVSNCHFTSLKLSPYPSLPVCLSICLSVCLSICLSTHVSIYLSICLSLRLLLFLSPSSSIYSVCVLCGVTLGGPESTLPLGARLLNPRKLLKLISLWDGVWIFCRIERETVDMIVYKYDHIRHLSTFLPLYLTLSNSQCFYLTARTVLASVSTSHSISLSLSLFLSVRPMKLTIKLLL